MQAVISPRFIMQHQRCGLFLPGIMANVQKLSVSQWESRMSAAFAKRLSPATRNRRQMRIRRSPKTRDRLRQGILEIFVVANSKTIPLHDDMTAKSFLVAVNGSQIRAFFRGQERRCYGIPALGKGLLHGRPVQSVDSLCNRIGIVAR